MVEWKKLGEICEIGTGANNREDACDDGLYPFFVRSQEVLRINEYLFNEEAILIPGEGGIGDIFHYFNGKYGLHQRTYRVHPISDSVYGKYIYYYLFANFKCYINKKSYKSTAASIRKPMLTDFPISIPSLSEQQRIVSILDTFTSSISNLKQQIEERRKQYEYERDLLLDLEGKEGVEMKKLGEVFDTRNGYTPSTKNPDFWEEGTIPWFKMEDIRDNGRVLGDSNLHITPKAIKGKGLFKANSIILATSATIGEHALITVEHLSNQRFTNFYPKKKFEGLINMKFVYYYMYLIDEWCKQHINQGGFASVDMNGLFSMDFPLLSLQAQSRIVSILDTFEQSISNLEEQLAMREKQYEYYRNQLLTFEGEEERGKT